MQPPSFSCAGYFRWLASGLVLVLSTVNPVRAADELPGARIYQEKCASCHGPQGEGTPEHAPVPLFGDRSLRELTQYINDSMPEGEPDQCAGEDAAAVASYIYDAFYSPIAQARLKPVQLQLARLSVRQYETVLADLITGFRGGNRWQGPKGLKGEYYKTRSLRRDGRVLERLDPVVDFDFGEGVPEGADFEKPEEFSAKWSGAVFAPETGIYEFIIHTDNGARLWVNDTNVALIDVWVRSGNDTEFRGAIKLLGGRVYPLRLEFFKFKEPRASIGLKWKPPHGTEEVIPARYLTDDWFPETYIVNTPFPPDDASTGFVQATNVSREWVEAAMLAGLEAAKYVSSKRSELAGIRREEGDRAAKIRTFCEKFVERAFRRPLTPEELEDYVVQPLATAPDEEEAVQRIVLLALKSPHFLLREYGRAEFDQYALASWLSFVLWDSLPDQELLRAASNNELQDESGLRRQAERMVRDFRTKAKMQEFLHHWLRVDHFPDISKDRQLYPDFTPEVVASLRTSLDLFLEEVIWSDRSDFRELLLSDAVYIDARLAPIYGVAADTSGGFTRVSLPDQHRAGILTHPYLMAGFGYDKASSPIHRGVFLAKSVLGRFIKPPPIAVAPLAPDLHADLTTRERVTLQTSPESCMTCHSLINSLGFTLENFDTLGRFRQTELGRPIDSSGLYLTSTGEEVRFNEVGDLARFLAESPECQQAFVKQLFEALVQQPPQAFLLDEVAQLHTYFADRQFNVQKLMVRIAVQTANRARELHTETRRTVTATGSDSGE
jgi:hypothetical protein